MSKKGKYAFWDGDGGVKAAELFSKIKQNYINKFYNIWMSKFKWSGLDKELAAKQENYIRRKFWADGTIAARPIKNTDLMVYAPWTLNTFDCYDLPETVSLVNVHNAPFIPYEPQIVGKDVVVGWSQPNHKPISAVVKYYVERMAQVDMVINTNLQLQKRPFLVGVNEVDKDKMEDIVDRILHNEVVVFADLDDLSKVQTLATQTPYVIDKLNDYKRSMEQELRTFLGVDNNGSNSLEQTHVSVDAVNANNDVINDYGNAIESEINKWLADVNRVFGRHITIEAVSKPVDTVHEEPQPQPQEESQNEQAKN